MINIDFNSVAEILKAFPNEDSCVAHLENLRWNSGIVSPFDPFSKIYFCKHHKYRCSNTGKYFNAKTGTIFHNSKIELQKWFIAIWIVSNKKSITSVELGKSLDITQKSAWYMLQKIKKYLLSDKIEETTRAKTKNELPEEEISTNLITDIEKLQLSEWLSLLKK